MVLRMRKMMINQGLWVSSFEKRILYVNMCVYVCMNIYHLHKITGGNIPSVNGWAVSMFIKATYQLGYTSPRFWRLNIWKTQSGFPSENDLQIDQCFSLIQNHIKQMGSGHSNPILTPNIQHHPTSPSTSSNIHHQDPTTLVSP